MRFFKSVSYLICGVMLLAGQAAYAEGELQNRELLEKSGVVEAVNAIPDALIEGLDEVRQSNPRMDAKFFSAWKATVPLAYRPEKLIGVIDAGMQKELTDTDRRELTAFYDSDLGKRIVALEKESNRATAAIREYGKNPAAFADRVALYKEIDQVSGASEFGATINLNAGIAMQIGMLAAMNAPVDIAKLKADAEKERPTIREQVQGEMLQTFAYTYRTLPVDDVKAYLEFLKTPAARKFNASLGRLLAETMTVQANALGQMLMKNITSAKPI